jgi:hypothetical protein
MAKQILAVLSAAMPLLKECACADRMPPGLVAPDEEESEESFRDYCCKVTRFCRAKERYAKTIIGNSLKHNSMQNISRTANFSAVCGLSVSEFNFLLRLMQERLDFMFPNSVMMYSNGSSHGYAENRMKLFVVLFRLKVGSSFRQLEVIFGWSHNVICEWFDLIIIFYKNYNINVTIN